MQGQGMYYTPSPLVFPDNQSHVSYLVASGLPSAVHFPPTSISQNVYVTSSLSSATSATVNGANTNFSWAHTVPTYMPWAIGRGPLVRFTAPMAPDPCTSQTATTWELLHNLGTTCTRSSHGAVNQHLKRRSDSLEEETEPQPSKQYISEEKMAARMNQLHISNNYSIRHQQDQKKTVTFEVDSSEESDSDELPSSKGAIQFSPELKKLMEPNPVMLKALMNDIEKPSMALVLWQPPGGLVREKILQSTEASRHLAESSQSSTSHTLVPATNSIMPLGFPEHNNNNPSILNLNSLDATSRYEGTMVDESIVDMDDMEL